MVTDWTPDDEALGLLDGSGNPFDDPRYRRAWCDAGLGWTDVSFGARTEDGVQAAVALLRRSRTLESLPLGYGGVAASRALSFEELISFLGAARRSARALDLRMRTVPVNPPPERLHIGGRVVAWTSLVHLDPGTLADGRFAKKGRLAISRAERAGGVARAASRDPEPFLRLYQQASQAWLTRYPADVIRQLAREGLLTLYDVELDGEVHASSAALSGEQHWMYWLAAQSESGRTAELGYLSVAALIRGAHAAGAGAVNLGASAGLPGVALFKRRFGAIDAPVLEHRSSAPLTATAKNLVNHLRGATRRP